MIKKKLLWIIPAIILTILAVIVLIKYLNPPVQLSDYEKAKGLYATRKYDRYAEAIGYLKKVSQEDEDYDEATKLLKMLYEIEIRSLERKIEAPSYRDAPEKVEEFRKQVEIYESELNRLIEGRDE